MDSTRTNIVDASAGLTGSLGNPCRDEEQRDIFGKSQPTKEASQHLAHDPSKSVIHRCFRILEIPSCWTEEKVLALLKTSCNLDPCSTDILKLFPALDDAGCKVGILSITRQSRFIDTFAPNDHDNPKKRICEENHITIDRFFYGFTPLNAPIRNPVVE